MTHNLKRHSPIFVLYKHSKPLSSDNKPHISTNTQPNMKSFLISTLLLISLFQSSLGLDCVQCVSSGSEGFIQGVSCDSETTVSPAEPCDASISDPRCRLYVTSKLCNTGL